MPPENFLTIQWVLVLVAATWHYALRCGFISDDHSGVVQRKDIIPDEEKNAQAEPYWVKVFNDGPVMYYTTRIMWKLGLQKIAFAWHLLSLIMHLANTYLVYLFFLPIKGEPVALTAALFWGISPMLNQNVVWISGRPYLFGFLFAMIGAVCWQQPYVFIPFYLLAVMTNISITFIPILLLIAHPEAWQAKLYIFMMFAGAVPFIMWKFKKRFTKSLVIDKENFKFKWRKLSTLSRIIAYYIWTLFVPVRMGWYHQAGFRYNVKWEKINYLTVVGAGIIGWLAVKGGLPGWWFLLGILPNANLYATNSFLQDRYLYFASVGIAVLLAPVLLHYPIPFYCIMTFYAVRAYMYSRHLINDEAMYRENWRNHPNSDYAVNNLSYFLIQKKRYDEARVVIMRGIELNRMNKMLWYNLGVTWAAQGHFNSDEGKFKFMRALDCWKMALQIEPRWSKPAEDLKKLITILVDQKVLTISKDEAATNQVSVEVPALSGMESILGGSKP